MEGIHSHRKHLFWEYNFGSFDILCKGSIYSRAKWALSWATRSGICRCVPCYTCDVKQAGAPNDAQFARLWRTRTSIRPLEVCPELGVDPLKFVVRGAFTLWNFAQRVATSWKVGIGRGSGPSCFGCNFLKARTKRAQIHISSTQRTFTTCFPFVTNTCVKTVHSKAASTPQISNFIGCEKSIALHSKSKKYTQDGVTLNSCERLEVLNWHGVITSTLMNREVKIPP